MAVVLAIFIATLFPFDFSAQLTASERVGSILFWLTPVAKHWVGWVLNVLFFMPFGWALAWWARTAGRRPLWRAIAAGLAGCVLSVLVEYLQLYVPQRNGSWDDVVMNTLGSLAGWLVFEWLGVWTLRLVGEVLGEFTTMLDR